MLKVMQCVQLQECWENSEANAMCAGVGVMGEH